MAGWRCRDCGQEAAERLPMCRRCLSEALEPIEATPEQTPAKPPEATPEETPPERERPPRSCPPRSCPHCGAPVPHPRNQQCVRCNQPLTLPALRLELAWGGQIDVNRGEQVVIGRHPEASPHAELFRAHGNVSRVHATIGVDAQGQAWIRQEGMTNTTHLNGKPLELRRETPLDDGDELRLAEGVHATVHLGDAGGDHEGQGGGATRTR
jgi:hypothetical protein